MSRNTIIVLIYHRHKLVDLISKNERYYVLFTYLLLLLFCIYYLISIRSPIRLYRVVFN
jgi:hypothetical protein